MVDYITWTGASGAQYNFQLDAIGTVFKDIPGVYIFCLNSGYLEWQAIYIGETISFYDRLSAKLAEHHAWDCIYKNMATHVCTLHVAGLGLGASRLTIETDLRRRIWTPCNLQ